MQVTHLGNSFALCWLTIGQWSPYQHVRPGMTDACLHRLDTPMWDGLTTLGHSCHSSYLFRRRKDLPRGNPPDTLPGVLSPTPFVAVTSKVSSEQILATSVPRETTNERCWLARVNVCLVWDDELLMVIVYSWMGYACHVNGSSHVSSSSEKLTTSSFGAGGSGGSVVAGICVIVQ